MTKLLYIKEIEELDLFKVIAIKGLIRTKPVVEPARSAGSTTGFVLINPCYNLPEYDGDRRSTKLSVKSRLAVAIESVFGFL